MTYRYFPQHAFTRMAWKNGGGNTLEIHRQPETGSDWLWRLSVAQIEQDGLFSAFPGCDRTLVLLVGEGMQLDFDGRQIPVLPPYGQVHFAGEQSPDCHLIDGPTQDFNAIWKRDALDMQVQRRAMTGSLWCIAEAGVSWFVYFLSGTGRIKDDPDSPEIIAGDAIWLQPGKGQPRLVLEAHGEALWIKIQTR
jgi:uncharacterized protein